jgi:hypothetical protein
MNNFKGVSVVAGQLGGIVCGKTFFNKKKYFKRKNFFLTRFGQFHLPVRKYIFLFLHTASSEKS